MAGFVALLNFQSRIKFWCSLIVNSSETRHMLIAQTVIANYKPDYMRIMKKPILVDIIFLLLVCTWTNGSSQNKSKLVFRDFVIKYEKINFHFLDSVHPFTVFIEPDGFFYFRKGFYIPSGTTESRVMYMKEKGVNIVRKDTLIKKSDNILEINSFYPPLIKHDSSIINHYPFDFHPLRLSYELQYSYILKNLECSEIYRNKNLIAIRIIFPTETSGRENDYAAIQLDFGKTNKLIYSRGIFDSNSNYQLTTKDSCSISDKEIYRFNKILEQINFDNEYYFTETGLAYPKFLIEYKTADNYYVLERQLYSSEKKDKKFNNILFTLLSFHTKHVINK